MWRLLDRAMSADRWQGTSNRGLQFPKEVDSLGGVVVGIFVVAMDTIRIVKIILALRKRPRVEGQLMKEFGDRRLNMNSRARK